MILLVKHKEIAHLHHVLSNEIGIESKTERREKNFKQNEEMLIYGKRKRFQKKPPAALAAPIND